MIKLAITFMLIGIFLTSTTTNTVYSTALSPSDIDRDPEGVCVLYGDEPEWKDLCDWINICDDNGSYTNTSDFCTGDAVRYKPYGGCPIGYHSEQDDESGKCYKNKGFESCRYEDLILDKEGNSCNYIIDECKDDPDLPRCTVTVNLGTPNNEAPWDDCEPSVADHCIGPYKSSQTLSNGTHVPGNDLNCRQVNATDFRVTVRDWDRHNFDKDFDGIGCETMPK
jgi:hypothetical protein